MPEEIKAQLPIDQPEPELPTPSFWEKLKANKWKILGGILGVFVFAGAVFGAYKLGRRQIQPAPQPTPTPEAVVTPTPDSTADWETYTNTKYGYSIRYPNDWTINRGPGNLSDAELSKQRDVDFYSLEAAPPSTALIIYTNESHPTGEEANCQTLEDCISKVSEGFPSGETQDTTFLGEPAVVKIYDRTTESYIQTNYHLFFLKTGDFYHLHFYSPKENYNQSKDTFNLILSTFRFLEEEVETGTVTGKLCYPSEFLPKGRILAKNLTSGKVYAQEYPGSPAGGVSSYSFELPSGKYILKYLTRETGTSGYSGYYSTCSKYLDIGDCENYESWEPLLVEVIAGQTTKGIDLCDFYYVIPEKEPEF